MSSINRKHAIWGERYSQQKLAGECGWTSPDSYKIKKQRLKEVALRYTLPYNVCFLELGCGAGNITSWAAENGWQAIGVDIVPEAISWARERTSSLPNIQFILGDVSNLCELPDNSCDIVFDGDCLHMLFGETRARCLCEVWRVLRPGGIFILGGNVCKEKLKGKITCPDGYFDANTNILVIENRNEYQLRTVTGLIEEIKAAGFDILLVNQLPPRGKAEFIEACLEIDAYKVIS